QVIITTAFQRYALKGYELNVTDYLLKPFTFPRFLQAATKARDNLQPASSVRIEYLFVKTENRLEKVAVADILFVEGMRDYRRIHTVDKRIMTLQTFRELEKTLPPRQLCRVHKSWMVAPGRIQAVERSRILIGERRIPISDTYRTAFFTLIKHP
ncbi:MAG: response regulator transcription factor, partial [Bacteroidota bacterium]